MVKILLKLFALLLFGLFCANNSFPQSKSLINTAHLDHLYQEIEVNNVSMGIVHIYADYPDYKYVEAEGEGIACVDDAARAEVFYIKYYELHKNKSVLKKIKNLTNFLLYMQTKSGFFSNFIWNDYTIDSTYKTSVAGPNWWTWRAMWALTEAENLFISTHDQQYVNKIKPHLMSAFDATHNWLIKNYSNSTKNYDGYELPIGLPFQNAADQSAVLVKAFCAMYSVDKNPKVKSDIEYLCNGIMKMQAGSKDEIPYCAFLSWENTWHEWGNSQADALLEAGNLLKQKKYVNSAVKEIKYFYPFLISKDYYNNFIVKKKNGTAFFSDTTKFSQIAYGLRPMVWASIKAYEITRNKSYAKLAGEIGCWLFGKNPAQKQMYNPDNGVCFDGIISKDEINNNSGAESTIESLLSLIKIENNSISRKIVQSYYNSEK
jgi:hypothetical protein